MAVFLHIFIKLRHTNNGDVYDTIKIRRSYGANKKE